MFKTLLSTSLSGPGRGILGSVARGWESKSVQAQIESANARQGKTRVVLDAKQAELERKLDSLLLHRTRVLRDLESCRESRYRKTLEDGLTYLEEQLTQLGWKRSAAAKTGA